MKSSLTILFLLTFSLLISQDDSIVRKGSIQVEAGSSLITGVSSGSGGNSIFDDGNNITQLGLDIGKFVSEDLVIKLKAGLLTGIGSTVTNLSAGAKYYIGGIAPVELDAGFLAGSGSTEFIGELNIGYAIILADNIYLEPKGGIIFGDSSILGSIKATFAMLF